MAVFTQTIAHEQAWDCCVVPQKTPTAGDTAPPSERGQRGGCGHALRSAITGNPPQTALCEARFHKTTDGTLFRNVFSNAQTANRRPPRRGCRFQSNGKKSNGTVWKGKRGSSKSEANAALFWESFPSRTPPDTPPATRARKCSQSTSPARHNNARGTRRALRDRRRPWARQRGDGFGARPALQGRDGGRQSSHNSTRLLQCSLSAGGSRKASTQWPLSQTVCRHAPPPPRRTRARQL